MGDSAAYRSAAETITSGWGQLTERTPGYPLLLWLTGSVRTETTALFLAQLLMHAISVLMVVRVAARLGLGAC